MNAGSAAAELCGADGGESVVSESVSAAAERREAEPHRLTAMGGRHCALQKKNPTATQSDKTG